MTERTVDGKDVPERTDKRITCPVCGGNKHEEAKPAAHFTPDGYRMDITYVDTNPCVACDGAGQVCECPVCEGSKERKEASCPACNARGWVPIPEWDKAVDVGHKLLMAEHKQGAQGKAQSEQADVGNLVMLHRMAMKAIMVEWEKFCKKNEMHLVDAGAFGRLLGGMTVAFFTTMEEELEIEKHQVFARFINGMLHYMETRGDMKGVGIVAGQSGACQGGMLAMEKAKGDKEQMN